MTYIKRQIKQEVLNSLDISPIVFVNGARQFGKSTLVQNLSESEYPAEYISFDSPIQMSAATSNPLEFLTRDEPLIIDEVQLVPEIFRSLKIMADNLRKEGKSNGQYLITGSANIMALPKLSDALVGRMSVLTMYPLSVAEAIGGDGDIIDKILEGKKASTKELGILEAIRLATFPEISGKKNPTKWFDGYITTILQRDVRVISDIDKIYLLPNLLRILAARAGGLLNDAEIARDMGLNAVTTKSYRNILKVMFLTFDVPPFYRNIGKRMVKSAKGYVMDTMMLCYLLGYSLEDIKTKRPELFGHVLENFVATELLKLTANTGIKLMHFRTSDNKEVDFILETPQGKVIAFEVKSSENINGSDFKGIKELQSQIGDDLIYGAVLYQGDEIVKFGEKLRALPIKYLWT